ncbi:citrate synthase [Stella sp.]|uniref:citrate synthase n=1 Tax=Stella sp. TaxID=2912054 RepID=UPI0035B35154
MNAPVLIDADEAIRRLGVRRATLYAYASRGLVRSEPHPDDPRRSLYAAEDIDRLAARRRLGRSPGGAAARTLDWGLPVLDSAITLVEHGCLSYRGVEATGLAESATLEDTARLLWDCGEFDPFAEPPPPAPAAAPGPAATRCIAALADAGFAGSEVWGRDPRRRWAAAARLLRRTAAAAVARPPGPGATGPEPISAAVARAWTADPTAADLVRRALVLAADHELNASTFAARVVASTGASLAAAVVAGMAALTGPRHGGMTERVQALLEEVAAGGDARATVARRLARGDRLPGFGHPLYPAGDPRASALLARVRPDPLSDAVAAAVAELTGEPPNIDFALVALARGHGLPAEAPFTLFLVGRTAGWIAHALEQQATGGLIRPRARYVGRRRPSG